ncbi:MAG TPA: hypothetical protein P5026_04485 [Kiritimatiellia bacterium]|nr:hypothetical protein [Kiritimatiellia bacterium]HRU70309.1 hypothetical protein [Kiritimatiellia bacterium]
MTGSLGRMRTHRTARYNIAVAVVLATAVQLNAAEAPVDPQWQQAADLFAKRHWAGAEKTLLAYAKRTPPPCTLR